MGGEKVQSKAKVKEVKGSRSMTGKAREEKQEEEQEREREQVRKAKREGNEEKRRKSVSKGGKKARVKGARAMRPVGPVKQVTDSWSAKDFVREGVKRLTQEKRWVELRVLNKWWRTYARMESDVLLKTLLELKEEREVISKREDRMWKMAQEGRKSGVRDTMRITKVLGSNGVCGRYIVCGRVSK
jgi:hypothetical protein